MKKLPPIHVLLGVGGFFFVTDRIFKFLANGSPSVSHYLIDPWLGWEFLANPGIAFSLPVPQFLMIVGTPIILLWLYYSLSKEKKKNKAALAGLLFIVLGALSNFVDRLLFGYTIDYFRVITSVINIADVMIIAGVIVLLLGEKNKEEELPS